MIRVDNKKTIKHVADTSFRADKMRNLFAVIAIALTTVLFTSIFTVTGSLMSALEESTMRQVGTSAHGGFKYLTVEQYENLKNHPDIKEISYSVVLATAENAELAKRPTEIRYANDALAAEMKFSMPTTGRLPEADDEIATDTLVLERLGVSARLGEYVTLKYSVCGVEYTETFKLVGFWEGDILMNASQVWLNRSYVERILSGYDMSDNPLIGSIDAAFNFADSWNIESKILNVITDSGYDVNEIAYGVNWAYEGGTSADPQTVVGVIALLLTIIFCGYLMISNVFLISVAKDVRFYGLLKTIGTTGKQIRVLIRRQALLISFIGIPIGLLLGCIVGGMLTPYILGILDVNTVKVTLHLWVFIFSAVFTLITIFISIQKALKLAAKVSPIEALHANDVSGSIKKNRKRSGKIGLWKMAAENVGRNRKKAILVTVSLSLGLIILNGAYSLANSFDMNKYLSDKISHDFVVGDASCFNVFFDYTDQDTLSDDFMAELSRHNGIESIEKVFFTEKACALDDHWDDMVRQANEAFGLSGEYLTYMQETIESGTAIYHVYGIDDPIWEDFTVYEGEIDLEKLHSGDYVVVSPFDTEGKLSAYHVGDTIQVFGKNGEGRTCEIIAIAKIPYNISIQHSHPVPINIYLPSDVFLDQVEQKCPMLVTLDITDSEIDSMEDFLANYCEVQDPNMQYVSRASFAAEYENTQRTYKMVGSVVSALLAFIGIANFANTSITSIMARKRELAMLQSIGMTVKQQRIMLMLEGMVYTALTAVFTWTVGIGIESFALTMITNGGRYYTLKFTVVPSVVCMPVLFLISVVIPVLCQRYVNGKSVVERMREAE